MPTFYAMCLYLKGFNLIIFVTNKSWDQPSN